MGTTTAQKKLFFNLKKIKNQLQSINENNLSPENVREIASRLDVKEAEVVEMDNRIYTGDHSLNNKVSQDIGSEWQDMLVDENETQDITIANKDEYNFRKNLVFKAMNVLNSREKEIIKLRRLSDNPKKLEALSQKYKISRERVRQIEEKALEKLQKEVTKNS